jgi:uncharacterized membrane protein YoaK (UPF0700 family)
MADRKMLYRDPTSGHVSEVGVNIDDSTPGHTGEILIWDSVAAAYVPGDPLVQGLYAAGSSVTSPPINPVLVGGSDYAGSPELQNLKVDSGGQIYIGNSSLAVTGTFYQATQPVSIATMPSTPVTGTFYQATQPVSIASMPSTPVTGTFWQATQPVSGTVAVSGSVAVTGTFYQATQPVSGTFWQATQPVSIATMPSTPVTGTFWQATQPVSGTVGVSGSVAVTGTFYQATQPVSIASMPSTPVTGTFWQATQPVSGTVAVTGTFWQATQPVSIASMPSTPVTGTFWQATQPVSGTVAVSGVSGVVEVGPTGSANTKTNPFFSSATDGTNVVTASISALGVAPTGTKVETVNNCDIAFGSGGYYGLVTQAVKAGLTAIVASGSSRQVYGYTIFNPNTYTVWVSWYNNSSATVGATTNMMIQIGVPAGAAANLELSKGVQFGTGGIQVAAATTETGFTNPATGCTVTTFYF